MAKTDHKEGAEGTAAKTVESETNIDTSSFNDNTLKDQKKSKEEGKKDCVDKHTEEEDDSGNYQILDALDDQTDEQMDDGDQEGSSDTQQTGPEESFQVLDSVDDEGKTHQEENSEMEASFQELGSVPENQAASGQEDSRWVQDDGSTVKQQSEGDEIPVVDKSDDKSAVKDAGGKDPDASNEDNLQVLDTRIAKCCKDSKDMEILTEDQPFQDLDNKDDSKDPDSDAPEQETFEILDSIDDQTATEDDSETLKTPSDHISEKHIRPKEEEDEDTYQVIDSLEDQPATTEIESETDNKEKRTKKGRTTARKDDGPSKRSDPTAIASKSEEKEKSPRKQDKVVKKYETRRKLDTTAGVSKNDKEATEETVYEIVDSVEDEPVQVAATTERPGRRRSARGKKEDKMTSNLIEASETLVGDEEAPYKILDSVEDETVDDEPTVTTRSTRGKRTSKKDALIEKTKKEDMPTRRRQTPARESQERNREETPKKEGKEPLKESTPTKKSDTVEREDDATYEILDSVEDEVVKDDRPTTARKGKRGRPRKEVKKTKNDSIPLKKDDKDACEKVAEEEEVTYQILDSVEDKTVDDQPPTGRSESSRKQDISINDNKQTKNSKSLTGSTKNEEEQEEPMYQILDSLEDDQEELTATEVSDRRRNKQSIEEASAEKDDTQTVEEASKTVIVTEESLYEIVDDLEEVNDELSAAEGSGTRDNESTSGTDIKKEDKSTTKSQSDTATPEEEDKLKSPEKNTTSTLVNLDEVSEEEEDYPDDTAEEEELRKRQAATKEKQERETKTRVERRTKERERRSRSGNSRGRRGRGGTRRAKEKEEEKEVDAKELVTLDEVGADEAEEERAAESREGDGEITEGELQTLVTLDEFVEEEEDGKGEQSTLESRPPSQEDESADSFNPEVKISTHAFYFQTWGNFSEAL